MVSDFRVVCLRMLVINFHVYYKCVSEGMHLSPPYPHLIFLLTSSHPSHMLISILFLSSPPLSYFSSLLSYESLPYPILLSPFLPSHIIPSFFFPPLSSFYLLSHRPFTYPPLLFSFVPSFLLSLLFSFLPFRSASRMCK